MQFDGRAKPTYTAETTTIMGAPSARPGLVVSARRAWRAVSHRVALRRECHLKPSVILTMHDPGMVSCLECVIRFRAWARTATWGMPQGTTIYRRIASADKHVHLCTKTIELKGLQPEHGVIVAPLAVRVPATLAELLGTAARNYSPTKLAS